MSLTAQPVLTVLGTNKLKNLQRDERTLTAMQDPLYYIKASVRLQIRCLFVAGVNTEY